MQESIRYIREQLTPFYPLHEIQSFTHWILESACCISRQDIRLGKDKQLSENEHTRIQEIVSELKKYRPIQYILGKTEFYGLTFEVNENVLIPRPETEELVDRIIRDIRSLTPQEKKNRSSRLQILDIGTGSGCIAVSLAHHLPEASVYAIDVSDDALSVARKNAALNQTEVSFFRQDIFQPFPPGIFPAQWDLIVSNPPYVTPEEKKFMEANVLNYEPHVALFVPEEHPLLFYETIAEAGLSLLKPGGYLYFEVSSLHGKETARMLGNKGYKNIMLQKDISGKDRMIKASL